MKKNDQFMLEVQKFVSHLVKLHNNAIISDKDKKKLHDELHKLHDEQWIDCYLPTLKRYLQLDDFLWFSVLVSFIFEIDMEFWNQYVSIYHNQELNFRYIASLYACVEQVYVKDLLVVIKDQRINLLFQQHDKDNTPILSRGMLLHPWCIHYMCEGILPIYDGFSTIQKDTKTYFSIFEDEKKQVYDVIKNHRNCLLLGRKGIGKKTLLQTYVNAFHKELVVVDLQQIHQDDKKKDKWLYYLCLAFILHDGYGVLLHVDKKDVYEKIDYLLSLWNCHYVIISSHPTCFIDCVVIAMQDFIPHHQIKRVCEAYNVALPTMYFHWNAQDLKHYIEGKSTKEVEMGSPYATKISCRYSLTEWIGDDRLREQITLILYFIKHRYEIMEKAKTYQKGIQILLHGVSGTGKTMMASIIAKELKQPLYRVDLSMVNDKYIGESEKHMEELFQQAQQVHGILLFDEADVLFAKRTKISSSNDRHANNMTAFLLQRLESFEGLVILTSNFLHNFDDAFLRRMRFIVKFEKPQREDCIKKWQMLLDDISYEGFTCEELDQIGNLTLARIEQAFLIAIAICHKEGKVILERSHMYDGIRYELMKQGEILQEKLYV